MRLSRTHGYCCVTLLGRPRYQVHRLVLAAFVGPCPVGYQCAHLNNVRDDNRVENLAWVTPKENISHKWLHGTMPAGDKSWSRLHPERLARGDRNGARLHPESRPRGAGHWSHLHPEWQPRGVGHGMAKLTEADIVAIRAARAAGEICRTIAERHGVSKSTIHLIDKGKIWTHVP